MIRPSVEQKFVSSIDILKNHHIIPKCLDGTNCGSNLVKLTSEKHYLVHQLLVKCTSEIRNLCMQYYGYSGKRVYIENIIKEYKNAQSIES